MQSPNQMPAPTSPSLVPRSPTLGPVDWVGDAAASLLGDHEARPINSSLLKDKLQISMGETPRVIPISEVFTFDKGLFLAIRAVQTLRRLQSSRTIVIGIAGPSGSGKSHFAKELVNFLPGSSVITMDNYMQREKVAEDNFDDPNLLDFELLLKNVTEIQSGRPTLTPVYSFQFSARTGFVTTPVPQSKVLIVEGTYALKAILRPVYDIAISVTGGVHFDLVKRVLRDITRVGQNPSEVINQITDTVFPMYKAFIEPDLCFATIKIQNTFNPFQGFKEPLFILKSDVVPSIAKIKEIAGEDAVEVTEEYQDVYMYPPGDSPDSCSSWIRVRENLKDRKHHLMFSEWLCDGDFIICPRIDFEVGVRVMGGLLSLGYSIGFHVHRNSHIIRCAHGVVISLDKVSSLPLPYVQIKGSDRNAISTIGSQLGLAGHYQASSYIELLQPRKADGFAAPTSGSSLQTPTARRALGLVTGSGSGMKWHPEAEAKVSQNLRLKDEEAAEALASSVQALHEQQKRMEDKLDEILSLLKHRA